MSSEDNHFQDALAALFAPLAQAMVAKGVTIGQANEALKKALLDAALETSDTMSDSRASLLTGIHRKDVKRLRDASNPPDSKKKANAAAMVIGLWATAPEYQSKAGNPQILSRDNFDALVRQTRADMAPGTVLKLLLDQGAIEETEEGFGLLAHAFLPGAGSAEQVAAYRATLEAHLKAATNNLLSTEGDPRHFDRAVRYSHLSAESAEALRSLSAEKAQELLQEINTLANTLQTRDADETHTDRFVFGAYILTEGQAEDDQ